ncbi:MAG: 3-oxoacyl-[acyl-carrier protein] reductase [Myxococcota bacterium]|jgi:3-oxoacyl-[acyl-carrier protein] reductase
MNLGDVRAVVTGGARGMGEHFVRRLAESDASVFFCDVNAEGIASTSEATGAAGTVADVSSETDVERLFDEATAAFGAPPNVLVNNAGIIRDGLLLKRDRKTGELTQLPKAEWDAVLSVNLTGPFLCMRSFARRCVEAEIKPAVAINMSSISRHGNRGQSNYSAAKAALIADTVVWAKELGRYGIRVGAIAPGFIRTPMVESMRPETLAKILAPVPLGRIGEPEEIWQTVRFIVENEYFSGRCIEVDGGLRL